MIVSHARNQVRHYDIIQTGLTLLAGLVVVSCCGCPPGSGSAGVTGGGAQDIASARQVIAEGRIPDPDAITVEGFLSEHSIEVDEPPSAGLLYTTGTGAWNRDFDALTPFATLALGFGTTIDTETFQREPQNLCLVIDRSGSMADAIDLRTYTPKLIAVQAAIDRLLAQLNADDTVSIVSFNEDPTTDLRGAAGNDIAAIKTAIDGLTAEGATDVARGMLRGYSVLREFRAQDRADRILVFTDARITSGQRDSDGILSAMEIYAGDDIGTSIFGVGADFGQELAYDISQIRGGNFFFLNNYERMIEVFDEEFDYLVTPVAYDVQITANIPFTFDVQEVYGMPNDEPISHAMTLNLPTLFLSSREGGGVIMLRLRPSALADMSEENDIASIDLTYQTPEGEPVEDSVTVTLPAGLDPLAAESYFETPGTRRAVLLLNTALVLKNACADTYARYYFYDYDDTSYLRAVARITEFLPVFDELAEGLEDRPGETSRSLSEERALLLNLLANIEARMTR